VKTDRHVEFQLPVEDKLVLDTALGRLKDLEQTVVQEFYFRDRNQTEIARGIGISCNYVSHILRSSTKKLKKILVTDELKEAQMEVALLRKRMEDQARLIEEQTVVDSQTRLYNRRYFDSRLEEEISRGSRHQHALSIMLVRLEGYAQIGRTYGTIRAEETIRGAANLIAQSVRKADIVTRFDDCTYGLILPHTGPQASAVAGRLGTAMDAWTLEKGLREGRAPIDVLIGYASYPTDAETSDELIDAAVISLMEVEPCRAAA
jgi:diguanylate cyclase (GGDEF)-like protein